MCTLTTDDSNTVCYVLNIKQDNLRISPVDVLLEQRDPHAVSYVLSDNVFSIRKTGIFQIEVNPFNVVISLVTPETKIFICS